MQTRRMIVLGISAIVGAVVTWLTIYVLFRTNPQHFAYSNVGLLFISVFCIVGIWLDYFLDTKILKS